MHKKIKISESELENVNGGGHTAVRDNRTHEFICSHCGERCQLALCERTSRTEGCENIISAKCDKCGTWDDLDEK